jgi:hypothetical protein
MAAQSTNDPDEINAISLNIRQLLKIQSFIQRTLLTNTVLLQ